MSSTRTVFFVLAFSAALEFAPANNGNMLPGPNAAAAQSVGSLLSADRDASANWKKAGMLSAGGIPNRTTVCARVSPLGGGKDDTTNIQNKIEACPVGQVVQLSAGRFTIAEGNLYWLIEA